MSLSARYNLQFQGTPHPVSATAAVADTFYQGAFVSYAASGASGAVTPVNAAGQDFAGVVYETKTAAAGDQVSLLTDGLVGIPSTNFVQSDIGELVYLAVSGVASSNSPADLRPERSAIATDEPCGTLHSIHGGLAWLLIGKRTLATAKS